MEICGAACWILFLAPEISLRQLTLIPLKFMELIIIIQAKQDGQPGANQLVIATEG